MGGDVAVRVATEGAVMRASIGASTVEESRGAELLEVVGGALDRSRGRLTHLVLDFSGVTFINSSGLAACIELRNRASGAGAPTIIYGADRSVRDVLRMVRLERLFGFAGTAAELEAALRR